jgi:hypothetical protein
MVNRWIASKTFGRVMKISHQVTRTIPRNIAAGLSRCSGMPEQIKQSNEQ